MQFPVFDTTNRTYAWDRYKAFHIILKDRHNVEVVQFDTGEALVRVHGGRPDPGGRKYYSELGIRIATTSNDDGCPTCMLQDGTIIPAGWYGSSQQTLLIDDDSGHVIGVGGSFTIPYYPESHLTNQRHVDSAIAQGMPERFVHLSGGVAWFAGRGRPPVSNRPIGLYRPIQHTPEQWRQARDLRTAATACLLLDGEVKPTSTWNTPAALPVAEAVQYPTVGDMPVEARRRLAWGGLTSGTTLQLVSSIRLAPATTMPCTTSAEG